MFKEQSTVVTGNDAYASGQLTNVGPSLSEWSRKPLLDEGFGTCNPKGPDANAGLLDDQWLGALLETGYFRAAKLGRPQGSSIPRRQRGRVRLQPGRAQFVRSFARSNQPPTTFLFELVRPGVGARHRSLTATFELFVGTSAV